MKNKSIWNKYSYVWVTLGLFFISIVLHWVFAWKAYMSEQAMHQAIATFSDFLPEVLRDTFENWQSEFLQLIWQVAGLAFLFHVGSPQSKEGDDRKEEKIDYLIKLLDSENGSKKIKELDIKYPRK